MPNTNTEPAATIAGVTLGSLTALVLAALALVQVFDVVDVSLEQNAAIVAFIGAMWAVVIPMVYAIRGTVYAPVTVAGIKEDLATSPAVDPATAATLAK